MALSGRFGNTSGRPFLEGRLYVPRFGLWSDISFLVDTGADVTVLMPDDGLRSGIDYTRLTGKTACGGIGGTTEMFVEPAHAVFLDSETKLLHVYTIALHIAPATPQLEKVNSLLGRDVLDSWRMTYDPAHRSLRFEVLSAGQVVQVP